MSDVSVIGLGAMGAAIARAFMTGGSTVTVWNRSKTRLAAFANDGVACAPTAALAIAASPVTVICVEDYAVSNALLAAPDTAAALRGHTLIQCSTGTPADARAAERVAGEHGAAWLDAAILAYPREIGEAALIYIAGAAAAHDQCRNLLDMLSSNVRYLGEAVGAAAALDAALLSYYLCTHIGLVHGAAICKSEHVPVDVLAAAIVDSMPGDAEEFTHLGQALETGVFTTPPAAPLGIYRDVLQRILDQARDAGINDEIPAFAASLVERGMQAGLADEEVVSIIKVLNKQFA